MATTGEATATMEAPIRCLRLGPRWFEAVSMRAYGSFLEGRRRRRGSRGFGSVERADILTVQALTDLVAVSWVQWLSGSAKVRKVIEYLNWSKAGMLCSQTCRDGPLMR